MFVPLILATNVHIESLGMSVYVTNLPTKDVMLISLSLGYKINNFKSSNLNTHHYCHISSVITNTIYV